MKYFVWTAICVFLFFGPPLSKADELSDLKNQLDQLQKKIEQLEQKQKEQAQQIEKVPKLAKSVEKIKKQPSAYDIVSEALAKQVNIGGHLKFFLADQSFGERNDVDQHDSFSAGVSDLWLYLSKGLSDWISLTVAPELEVEAAATPSLGADISRSSSASVNIDLDEAYITMRLPRQWEVKAGAIYPYFSEEYASKNWWHEQYHQNNGLVSLESWQTIGIEVYRNFDFENFSLPVYIYPYLNGESRGLNKDTRFTDNNNSKNALVHMAPEFFAFGGRVRLLGSFGYGRWDDEGENDSFQWAAGADLTYQSFNLSGSYLYRRWEDRPTAGEDAKDKGWYVKLIYSFNPKWRLTFKYSDVDLWALGTAGGLVTDNYKAFSTALGYWITDNSTIIPQIEYVDAERSDGSEELNYLRYTLGWRTTF